MLYVEKYRPRALAYVVGNKEAVEKIRRWALEWDRGVAGKPLLIAGPVGIGKTAIAYAVKEELGWDLVEMNASDLRNDEMVERVIGMASSSSTLSGRRRLILMDDVDSMQTADRGGKNAIREAISAARQPVILTAVDAWEKGLSPIRSLCELVELRKINKHSIAGVLKKIAAAECIDINGEGMDAIADNSNGDIRSAINDLQALNLSGSRDRKRSIFDVLRTIFKATGYLEARNAGFEVDLDHDMFKYWIDENIPGEYRGKEEVAKAYRMLSDADLFDGRIYRRQYWGFLRYSNDLLSAGIALSKETTSNHFVSYSFPSYIRNLGSAKAAKAMKKAIGKKIAKVCHVPSKDGGLYLDLIRKTCNGNLKEVKETYAFSNEELAFILGVSEKKIEAEFNG
jgi:replication factor C large subunit